MLLVFAAAQAATCSWFTPLWNDGELAFRNPGFAGDLAKVDVGSAYLDDAGHIHPGDLTAPKVKLTLLADGALWLAAKDESVASIGVAALPASALHPSKPLIFNEVVRVRGQDTLTLRGAEGQRVVVTPQLPAWFYPNRDFSQTLPCGAVRLSVTDRAVEPWPAGPADGSVVPEVEIPLSATAGGSPVGTIRCKNAGEKLDSESWDAFESRVQNNCPWVTVAERTETWTKVRIEANESVVEGWVPSLAVGPVVNGFGYGTGGLGARLNKYQCPGGKLYAMAEGGAYAVATLAPNTVVTQFLTKEAGWTQVRVGDARWLTALDGELMMDPDEFARCTLVEPPP